MADFQLSLGNIDRVVRKFLALGDRVRGELMKDVVDTVTDPIVTAMKANCPVGTGPAAGLLRRSIGKKLKVYEDGTVIAVMGPKAGVEQDVGYDVGMNTGTTKIATRYPHWVEFGTVNNAPHPFARPAWDSDGGEVLVGRLVDLLSVKLDRLVPTL